MSAPTDPPAGLRERKKIKLRRAIQTEALRLFETQGYEHTTVEQIAEAAETSTTTTTLLTTLVDQAVTTIEPLLAALDDPTRTPP